MRNDVHSFLKQRANEVPTVILTIDSENIATTDSKTSRSDYASTEDQTMKQMILTGLATEQSFDQQGQAQFFLVFNNGELRVPCSEQAAQLVVQAMYGPNARSTNGTATKHEEEIQESSWTPRSFEDEPIRGDDGVEQA